MSRVSKADLGRADLFYMLKNVLGYRDYYEDTHLAMTQELMRIKEGERLLTLWPRGTFKSTTATVGYPLWRIAQAMTDKDNAYGDVRILIVGFNEDRAKAFMREIVGHLENPNSMYRHLYRGTSGQPLNMVPRNWVYGQTAVTLSSRRFARKEPTIFACGLGNIPTGMHFDIIILDDAVDPKDVESPAARDKTLYNFRACLPILEPKGVMLVIGTRWHERDLYSWIKLNAKAMGFRVSERAAYKKTKKGKLTHELAFPRILDHKTLKQHKASLGAYLFACNYLNNPQADDTKPFQVIHWREPRHMPPDAYEFVVCCDANNSVRDTADYTAIVVVAHAMYHHLLFVCKAYLKRHLASQVPQLLFDTAREVQNTWMPKFDFRKNGFEAPQFRAIIGETYAFQDMILNELNHIMQQRNEYYNVWPLPKTTVGKNRKIDRILGLKPRHDAQGILFNAELREDPHMRLAAEQYLGFPTGHDDFPDALSQSNKVFEPVLRTDDVIQPQKVHKTAEELIQEYEKRLARMDREAMWASNEEYNDLERFLFGQAMDAAFLDE